MKGSKRNEGSRYQLQVWDSRQYFQTDDFTGSYRQIVERNKPKMATFAAIGQQFRIRKVPA